MKQIFELSIAEKATTLAPECEAELLKYIPLHGFPKAPQWQQVACRVYKPRKKTTAFASLALYPVLFSPDVVSDETMKQLLMQSCEFLPLKMEPAGPILLHPILVVDCVDMARSTIEFRGSDRWEFFADRIVCGQIFKSPKRPMIDLVATDSNLPPEEDFYQWYHKKRYTGLRFKPLWQGET